MRRTGAIAGLATLLLSACLLSACATPSAASAPEKSAIEHAIPDTKTSLYPQGEKDTCGAGPHANLIGKPVTSEGAPAEDRLVRHIRPDSVITMEFSEKRLNVYVSKDGVIQKLACG